MSTGHLHVFGVTLVTICCNQIIGLYLPTQLEIVLFCVLVFCETEFHSVAQADLK